MAVVLHRLTPEAAIEELRNMGITGHPIAGKGRFNEIYLVDFGPAQVKKVKESLKKID